MAILFQQPATIPPTLQFSSEEGKNMRHLVVCIVPLLWTTIVQAQTCNSAPTALDDIATTRDDRALILDVLANDSDPDGNPLAVQILTHDCPGTVTADSTETVTFIPVPVPGTTTCSIDYRITDGEGGNANASVTVTVERFEPFIFGDGFEAGDTSAWSLEGTGDGGEESGR